MKFIALIIGVLMLCMLTVDMLSGEGSISTIILAFVAVVVCGAGPIAEHMAGRQTA